MKHWRLVLQGLEAAFNPVGSIIKDITTMAFSKRQGWRNLGEESEAHTVNVLSLRDIMIVLPKELCNSTCEYAGKLSGSFPA